MNKGFVPRKAVFVIVFALTIFSLTYIVMAASNEPGSNDDPIVTQSYVEMRNQQLRYYIDESVKKIQDSISQLSGDSQGTGQGGSVFEVVTVPAGKKLIAGGSTELILRAGQATAIDSPLGGIANVTVGKDLVKGSTITANHLLIVPRDDGRGAIAKTESIFMVKGSYRIE